MNRAVLIGGAVGIVLVVGAAGFAWAVFRAFDL